MGCQHMGCHCQQVSWQLLHVRTCWPGFWPASPDTVVELSNEDQIVELLTPFEKSSTSLLVDLAVNMAEWLSISDGKISSFIRLNPGLSKRHVLSCISFLLWSLHFLFFRNMFFSNSYFFDVNSFVCFAPFKHFVIPAWSYTIPLQFKG